jgi:Pyruvate/2-oxoacid:ferredoxin oxidoreductase gamma subunit
MEREGLAGLELPAQMWLGVITTRVPAKYVELNRQAFEAGRDVAIQTS